MSSILFAGLVVVPAGMQLFLLPIIPESPRYLLLHKNKRTKAEQGKQVIVFEWICVASRAVNFWNFYIRNNN